MIKNAIKDNLSKKAIRFNPVEKCNNNSPFGSWIGNILLALPEEEWPISNGRPMIPLLQLNLKDLAYKPENLKDVALLALFIDQENIPIDTPSGEYWLVRTYNSLENLVVVQRPDINTGLISLPLHPELIMEDYPCYEDWPPYLSDEESSLSYEFPNTEGLKIGGWPTLIQSEILWHPDNPDQTNPEYVLQIDSIEEANWYWGDYGIAYLGRDSHSENKHEWFLSWQSH